MGRLVKGQMDYVCQCFVFFNTMIIAYCDANNRRTDATFVSRDGYIQFDFERSSNF
jgi:hypothetical protein